MALDGSPASATALPIARTIADQLGCSLEVVYVAAEPIPAAHLRSELHIEDETVPLRILVGDPVQQLLHAANSRDVALVVLTTHGQAVESGRVLAHAAEGVAARARDPILFVRPEAAAALGSAPAPLHKLVFPFEGASAAARALKPAIKLAARLGGSIDLLYVAHAGQRAPLGSHGISPPRYVDEPYHEWPAWAGEVTAWLQSCCGDLPEAVPIAIHVRTGPERHNIGNAIVQFAAQQGADGIILVRQSRMEPGRAPTLRAVLNRSPCPVVLVAGSPRAGRSEKRFWACELTDADVAVSAA